MSSVLLLSFSRSTLSKPGKAIMTFTPDSIGGSSMTFLSPRLGVYLHLCQAYSHVVLYQASEYQATHKLGSIQERYDDFQQEQARSNWGRQQRKPQLLQVPACIQALQKIRRKKQTGSFFTK